MGIGARENRRSMTPMPDTGRTSPIARRAGCPSCWTSPIARRAGCPSCRTSPIARCAGCPSCRTSLNARRAGCLSACAESRARTSPGRCPSCRRVPCMGESRSMPVVPGESRAGTSPGRCPSAAKPRPNIRLSPTPPTAVLRTYFRLYAVAFHQGTFSGAAKADRWAARSPTHGAEPSGQPERSRITTYHWG